MIRKALVCMTIAMLAGSMVTPATAVEELLAPVAINAPLQEAPSVLVEPAPPVPMPHTVHAPIVDSGHGHYGHAICCPKPKVYYMNHPIMAMLMHKCKTGQAGKVVLEVPTGCCPVEVPVCVPLCCIDTVPTLNTLKGLFGRCVYEYCWPCGTKIRIVKRHTGDLVVHSYEL